EVPGVAAPPHVPWIAHARSRDPGRHHCRLSINPHAYIIAHVRRVAMLAGLPLRERPRSVLDDAAVVGEHVIVGPDAVERRYVTSLMCVVDFPHEGDKFALGTRPPGVGMRLYG